MKSREQEILDHSHHSPFEKNLYPTCSFCNPKTPLEALNNARMMQQLHPQKHDVQLEIGLEEK